jgi:hypothetical protein
MTKGPLSNPRSASANYRWKPKLDNIKLVNWEVR